MVDNITLIYTYYNYPERMAQYVDRWNDYGDMLQRHLKIIIVDDGSKVPAHTLPLQYPPFVEIYRVKNDALWNEKGARNLGVVMAKTDWVIFTDFDHWLEADDLERLLIAIKQGNTAYRFQRYNVDGTLHPKVHSESYLIERTRALQAGGFSECFTGQYGAAPYQIFCERFQKNGGRFLIMQSVKIYQRSNANNAQRAGDVTDKRKHDPNYGLIHFEWERTL